jgi:polysaccharide pyruvyl transferase WcaK-like protein
MMSLIGNCEMTMSMRYHFCVFSAVQQVPFLALQRSDKVTDLCTDLAWACGTGLDDMTTERLWHLAETLEQRRARASADLGHRVQALRERAVLNLTAVDALNDHTWH